LAAADLLVKINSLPSDLRKEAEDFMDAILKCKDNLAPKRKSIHFGKFKGRIQLSDDLDEAVELV
jgi:hypothetical protein